MTRGASPEPCPASRARFVESGWRLKPLLRLLITSDAYEQVSAAPEGVAAAAGEPDPATVDPANNLLWRMRLRRLESEAVRGGN